MIRVDAANPLHSTQGRSVPPEGETLCECCSVYLARLRPWSQRKFPAQTAVNLTGEYRCVQLCQLDHVGWQRHSERVEDINCEAGQSSLALVSFGGRIWAENWNEGAVYSQVGMIIQFDRWNDLAALPWWAGP